MENVAIDLRPGERIDEVNENIRLIQKNDGLAFGTDAYMLAAAVRSESRSRGAELGSGSGIVSLLCAARGKLEHIYAIELQAELAELGGRNIALNSMCGRITQIYADARELKPSDTGGELDVVFSNPPYMTSGGGKRCGSDIKHNSRHEENGTIADFCAAAARLLRYGGKFYTVWRPDRLPDLICALREHSLEPKRMTFVASDADTPPSIVLTEARLGGAPSLELTAPLILYREGADKLPRVFTERAAEVYRTCRL